MTVLTCGSFFLYGNVSSGWFLHLITKELLFEIQTNNDMCAVPCIDDGTVLHFIGKRELTLNLPFMALKTLQPRHDDKQSIKKEGAVHPVPEHTIYSLSPIQR